VVVPDKPQKVEKFNFTYSTMLIWVLKPDAMLNVSMLSVLCSEGILLENTWYENT
jgi:hypothetical protein